MSIIFVYNFYSQRLFINVFLIAMRYFELINSLIIKSLVNVTLVTTVNKINYQQIIALSKT